MYPNIPTLDLTNIITEMASLNNFPLEVTNEIITLIELITKQNYFEMNSEFYIQSEGLAMGAPSSAILSEAYLQYIEHIHIIGLLNRHKIISYYRYVDDMLIVYNTLHTNINCVLGDFNNVRRKIQFSMEEECNNQINFLDLTIVRTGNRLEVGIFRKPTATDIMIHNESCHPIKHKIAGFNYLINRLTSYPITKNNSQKEVNTINHLLKVNGYHQTDTNTLVTRRQQHKKENNDTVSY
jgi:hypothetical protein